MKKSLSFLSTLCIIALFLASCSTSKGDKYIPKDAVAVLKIDGKKIGKKIALETLLSGDIFKKGDSKKASPADAGIDLLSNLYVYALPNGDVQNSGVNLYVIVPIKNMDKWEAYIKKEYNNPTIKKQDGISSVTLSNQFGSAWKDHTAIIVINTQSNYMPDMATSTTSPDLGSKAISAFQINKKETITQNDKYVAMDKENYDIGLWVDYERMTNLMPANQMGVATMLTAQRNFVKGSYLVAGVNFDDGKIIADFDYYTNPQMSALLKQLMNNTSGPSLLHHIPQNNLAGVISYNINPTGIKSMLDSMGTTAMINDELSKEGLSIEGILNAFTGNILATVSDVKTEKKTQTYTIGGETETYTYDDPSANWVVSLKIKDQPSMDKLIQYTIQQNILQVDSNNYFRVGFNIYASAQNGYLVISSKKENIQQFYTSNTENKTIPSEITSNPLGLYIDMKEMTKFLSDDTSVKSFALEQKAKTLIENIKGYGGKIDNDHSNFKFGITFTNKKTNSLMQLINLFQKANRDND